MNIVVSNKKLLLSFSFAFLLMLGSVAARATIATSPLFVSTAVEPNVMLLIDNSGSMSNVIWATGFDSSTDYTNWSPSCTSGSCSPTNSNYEWTNQDGNIILASLTSGDCDTKYSGSGWIEGENSSGTIKCLKLPNPRPYYNPYSFGSSTRYTGRYLNYLFQTYANGTDLTSGQIPQKTRIKVAKNVATAVVQNNPNMRFGLSTFNPPTSSNPGPGGSIVAKVGSSQSTLVNEISQLSPESNTPLAETYYEITRYFRGLSAFQGLDNTNSGSSGHYTSPIQYRCQKNFVIVITDGFPTYDDTFPSSDPAYKNFSNRLPNWDGKAPTTYQSQYPNFPPYSDGFYAQGGNQSEEGYTLYLDDLALFGYDIDLMPSGTDLSGHSFNEAPYAQQNLITYTVGFSTSNQMLQDAAQYGHGEYFTARNEAELSADLKSAISNIASMTTAAASLATNSTRLTSNSYIYQARFTTSNWSGQLRALKLNSNGTVSSTPTWDAANQIPSPSNRNIVTYKPGTGGINFAWSNLDATQQTDLETPSITNVSTTTVGQDRLNYIRGDRTNESPNGLKFRARASNTVLGDIVHSQPFLVGDQNYRYDALPAGVPGQASYESFHQNNVANRPSVIYVGANDGMLHAFDANTGKEIFDYIPNSIFSKLSDLTDPSYNSHHQYFVDGSPQAIDAYTDINGTTAWHTILVGNDGAGGKGLFALNVTDPSSLGPQSVLWEFTPNNEPGNTTYGPGNPDPDLGYAIPKPTLARMHNGDWAAIFGNGYDSPSGKAVLYIVDLSTGKLLAKLDTGVGSSTNPDGLSSPFAADVDGDRVADYIYAGDLQGNMWKFDVTSSDPSKWTVAYKSQGNPTPLYKAVDANGNPQPITERPEVGSYPLGGVMVYFGTGKYYAVGDNAVGNSPQTQTFYGIRDRDTSVPSGSNNNYGPVSSPSDHSNLIQQSVLSTVTEGSQTVRVTSNNKMTDTADGWYINLPDPGERSVSDPKLRNGKIIFTTLIPNTDPCGYGGTSFLMELNALSGSRLMYTPFDVNGDGEFNSKDYATINVTENGTTKTITAPVSGRQSLQGIIGTPAIVSAGNTQYKYANGSKGGVDTTVENPGSYSGRQSWRQLR